MYPDLCAKGQSRAGSRSPAPGLSLLHARPLSGLWWVALPIRDHFQLPPPTAGWRRAMPTLLTPGALSPWWWGLIPLPVGRLATSLAAPCPMPAAPFPSCDWDKQSCPALAKCPARAGGGAGRGSTWVENPSPGVRACMPAQAGKKKKEGGRNRGGNEKDQSCGICDRNLQSCVRVSS